MSFFEKLGKAAVEVGKYVVEESERQQERMEKERERREEKIERSVSRYEGLSDAELIKIGKNTSDQDVKRACSKILRERGY